MGTLYLLPNVLEETLPAEPFFPASVFQIVPKLDGLIAESEKAARRFLRRFITREDLEKFPIQLLNEHTPKNELDFLLKPIVAGQSWGLISDAGLPCLADPGSELVLSAQTRKVKIVAFPGPSSIVLALQLSGLCGQRFSFLGYLPREKIPLEQALCQLEKVSQEMKATQIWIETPYRTAKLFSTAIETLQPTTLLSVALSLTTDRQNVQTLSIAQWRKKNLKLDKQPAVFCCLS